MTEHNQLQNTIGKMEKEAETPPKSPAQEDYDNGKQHLESGDLGQAAAAFHNALVAFEAAGDEKGIANAVHQLGEVCVAGSKFDQALSHFQRAYEICERLNDSFSLLLLQKRIALSYRRLGQLDQAVSAYLEVLDIYSNHNNPQGAVEVLQILAEIYMERGDKEKAADAYRTAASIHANFRHAREARALRDKADALEKDSEQ